MITPKKTILIVIDTLRADHLGCYGHKRNTSPAIDQLSTEGILFKNAFSPSSFTLPSITSILTSKYPSSHSVGFSQIVPLDRDRDITLPEILKNEGYHTAAFVSSMVLRKSLNLNSGFDVYDDEMTSSEINRSHELKRDGSLTNQRAFNWIARHKDENFFTFIHYFDVHGPYVCPEPFNKRFVNDNHYDSSALKTIVPDYYPVGGIPAYQVLNSRRYGDGNLIDYEKCLGYYISQYDGCISYCDSLVADLVRKLKELEIYDDTLLIITSDHGEAFGENNVYFFHGLTVTLDQIHVPLIIKPVKTLDAQSGIIVNNVSTMDILPTILDLCEIPCEELSIDGVSLTSYLYGTKLDVTDRILLSEIEPQQAIIYENKTIKLAKKEYRPTQASLSIVKDLIDSLDGTVQNFSNHSDELAWTGERYLPDIDLSISGVEIHYEHLHRYAFAAQFVKGKRVLDLASGEGYGSFMLAETAGHVTGIDIDSKAVDHARSKYQKSNLDFIMGSITSIPIAEDRAFDVIVCFEAIEHIKEHDQLMSEIKRLLKDDGLLIISTPNKDAYSDQPGFANPYHLKELYLDDFLKLIVEYLRYTRIFGQSIFPGSGIWALEEDQVEGKCSEFLIQKAPAGFQFKNAEKIARYYVAISSNAPLSPTIPFKSLLTDVSSTLHKNTKKQIEAYQSVVAHRDAQLLEKEHRITELEGYLKVAENQLHDRDTCINLQCKLIVEKDACFKTLDQLILDDSSRVDELRMHASNLEESLNARDARIAELRLHATNLERAVEERNTHIAALFQSELQTSEQLASINQSLVWRSVQRFQAVIDKVMPHNTRRRSTYDRSLRGLRILVNEGLDSFIWKFNDYRASKKSIKKQLIEPPRTTVIAPGIPAEPRIIPCKVSVVIPAKNAGPDFGYTLEKINSQKGLKEIEIIVVDSGSTDSTVDTALSHGAKVYHIAPEDFNHGDTRNLGVSYATGDYYLFLVQDAIPVNMHWLYDMVAVLEADSTVAAAVCRQLPRSNADLFASYSLWSHYRALDFNCDRISSYQGELSDLSPLDKRKLAGLEDTCCLVRKSIFEELKFKRIPYAEDLDLGMRILENKQKIAFLYSVAIIHSHNRNPSYFLKRTYVDSKLMPKILNYSPAPVEPNSDLVQVLGGILALYRAINASVIALNSDYGGRMDRSTYSKFGSLVSENLAADLSSSNHVSISCADIDHTLADLCRASGIIKPVVSSSMLAQYLSMLNDFHRYTECYASLKDRKDDYISTQYKLFAIVAGSRIANYFLSVEKSLKSGEDLSAVDAILSGGI